MSFIKLLEGIGDRLGILETAAGPDASLAVTIQTRIVTLRELSSEINSGEVRALADLPAELAMDFEKIFETAGIALPPKGWTVDKLRQLVGSERYKGMSKEEVQKSILDLLSSESVPAEEVVRDAMARDKALDSFEAFVGEKIHDHVEARNKKILEIEQQIKDLQEEIAGLKEKAKAEEEKWREWRKEKRAREREMALAISYVVDHPVITTDDDVC